ncbi:hypothetical protein HMPREF9554_01182 [Treponema phagedenis F0421]|nr:hypothetical protein HMPREF9554_01182 [Treponema phagedenis F0421]
MITIQHACGKLHKGEQKVEFLRVRPCAFINTIIGNLIPYTINENKKTPLNAF